MQKRAPKANYLPVTDLNDNPPKFVEPSFTCKLSIHAVRGQFVTITKAYDQDSSDHTNLMYKIINGNDLQTYTIEKTTGIITLQNIQNFVENEVSLLNVSVTDGVYTSFARVKIMLLPENVHAPIFSQVAYEANIKENEKPGVYVVTVKACDDDFGEYSKLKYSICTAEMTEYFSIDPSNGVIKTKKTFDRELSDEYDILVRAADGGGKFGFSIIKVKIDDVKDNLPHFLVKEYRTTTRLNIALNSTILKVLAVDPDEDGNKFIKYTFNHQASDSVDYLMINETNGDVVIIKPLTGLANKLVQFFVRAYDKRNPQLYSDVPVSIRFVTSSTEVPTLENTNRNLFVSESLSPGTVLTKLRYAGNYTLKFSIPMKSSLFYISNNAELLLMQTLDREKADHHTIFIAAETITKPILYSITEMCIHVQDENDNNPAFDSSSYSETVAENIDKMTSILKVTAKDFDSGSNGDIRYYFADDSNAISNIFDIDIYSGWITTLMTLDREIQTEYKFNVIASDNGMPKHITKVPVSIKLRDYNDNPAFFTKSSYKISVEENALPGTVILILTVSDIDEGHNDVDFFITDGDIFSQFQVRKTGELFISSGIDRESIGDYNLSLVAADGKFLAKTVVHVTVLDVNDNTPLCMLSRYKVAINESLAIGTPIVKISAIDVDENGTELLRYYLTGSGSEDFSIEKSTGILKIANIIDRETQPKYTLIAHVQDGLNLSWECTSEVVIVVNDLNDNKPEFSLKQYIVSLAEDAQVGTLVTKVHASDKDVGMNRKVLYSFSAKQDHFLIAKNSGIVTLAKPLDRESISMFNISVRSEDCGTPSFSTIASLVINVLDINDNPPEFFLKQYLAKIPENSSISTKVITVAATSKDTGVNAEIFYFIIGGNEQQKFVIDSKTGSVYVNENLDYEKTKGFFLTIQAVDGGTPPLSNVATLNISVLDINDNEPRFLQNSYRVKVMEDIEINKKIIQVSAVDDDSGQNSIVRYNIERGDQLSQFGIEVESGFIWIGSSLDRETIPNNLLEVRACDLGNPQLCSYVHVHVDILDINDNPPIFVQKNLSAVVQENRELGHVLLKFKIEDADDFPNSSPYTFDFRNGNEGGFFRLEQDGTLRTARRFNHKVRDSYQLQIRVFDNGTPPLFSDTWINVRVIEESQYPPIITPLEISINSYEDEFFGGLLGRVFASDQDEYDTLYYDLAIMSGEKYLLKSLFSISHENGSLYAESNLDVGFYKVNVTVSDGKFISSTIIKINVELVSVNMLQHAMIIQFRNITPEQFILSHRKGFIRSIRTAMRCRQKDVIIISVQVSNNSVNGFSHIRNVRSLKKFPLMNEEQIKKSLDILFTVKKQQVTPGLEGFFATEEIKSTVADNVEEIEEATDLIVEEVATTLCLVTECENGKCRDQILLSRSSTTIYTDVISFVAPTFIRTNGCECKQGFGGRICDEPVNACFSDPCPPQKLCRPLDASKGYQCICPHGHDGQFCERETPGCQNSSCIATFSSVSFSGKSYAHYKINKSVAKIVIENQMAIFLRIRTLQKTGTLLYVSGKIDYNILEISNGAVQYKFDLGSGEGFVSVSSVYVSDGDWHSISLERVLNSAKLVIDNKHVSQGSAPGVNGILNLQSHDIFIGAEVRPHPSVLGFEDIQRGFIGCMGDIRISLEPLPLYISGGSTIAALKRFTNVEFTCNPSTAIIQLGVCGAQPCLNGGACIDLDNENFKCQCHPRFSGKFCQYDLDPCASSPCLFGGRCVSEHFGNYSCNCLMHLSGKRCEFGKFCVPNPCQNGGICEEGDGVPHCMCRGYTGMTCDIDVNECINQPCGKGATCINEDGSFRCICPSYMTGASCGDPLYSNSITTKLKNLSMEHITGIVSGATIMLIIIIISLCIVLFRKKNLNTSKNRCKQANLNSLLSKEEYKHVSKMSNLEVNQRPISYTPATNENSYLPNGIFVNNLDVLRSYGSAGDELEIPFEYQKINSTNQQININACTYSDNESIQKQTWSDQMQLRTFSENKLNNEKRTEYDYHQNRLASLKSNSCSSGKSIQVPMPNISHLQNPVELSSNCPGQYHWDCSDWVRKSQNPLPDITEVPGAEIADSSSFHSNESNESQARVPNIVNSIGEVDPVRDIATLNEDITSEYIDSEQESCIQPFSLERKFSISRLSPSNDSENEDYKIKTGGIYIRHPNSYLPSYNISSETEEEFTFNINDLANDVVTSSERRRTKRGTSEDMFLLYPGDTKNGSNSDVSVQLCDIEDSEFFEFLPNGVSKHNISYKK